MYTYRTHILSGGAHTLPTASEHSRTPHTHEYILCGRGAQTHSTQKWPKYKSSALSLTLSQRTLVNPAIHTYTRIGAGGGGGATNRPPAEKYACNVMRAERQMFVFQHQKNPWHRTRTLLLRLRLQLLLLMCATRSPIDIRYSTSGSSTHMINR